MTPSTTELVAGQKAYERTLEFQRYSGRGDFFFFGILMISFGAWDSYHRLGWKAALVTVILWSIAMVVSLYQYQRMKKRASEASALLKTLKAKYGENVYQEIEKGRHSLFYYVFLKRYWPFHQQSIRLP